MVTGSFERVMLTGNTSYSNLEREDVVNIGGCQISKADYLHGDCTEFALALHDVYGYDIVRLYSVYEVAECTCRYPASINFPFVHDFCVCGDGVFIDVRGATDKFADMVLEFEDYFDMYGYGVLSKGEIERIRENSKQIVGLATHKKLYSHAVRIIKRDSRVYDIRKYVKCRGKYTNM